MKMRNHLNENEKSFEKNYLKKSTPKLKKIKV